MRFHVVGVPFTQTTDDYPACAFTMKVRKFAKMMHAAGHEVFLYSGDRNTTPCTEHVQVYTEEQRAELLGDRHYSNGPYDASLPGWQRFNATVAAEIAKRADAHDFVCVISGVANAPLADMLPELMTVEYGIGYPGTFAKYRVFESYAWMHSVYGTTTRNPADLDGRWYDAVIPGYIDADDLPAGDGEGDYYAFVGRLIERKGYQIAVEVTRELGQRLVVAGPGEPPPDDHVDYVGIVGPAERAALYGGAIATFAPTIYVEPYGNVVPEANMTGTPAITTDWGAFTETVEDGVNGWRCRTLGEFVQAAQAAPTLDRAAIRQRTLDRYSLPATAVKYERYFRRLQDLWGDGWYTL